MSENMNSYCGCDEGNRRYEDCPDHSHLANSQSSGSQSSSGSLSKVTVQEIQFELMRRASFNDYDGDKVVESLKANPSLWQAVLIGAQSYSYNEDSDAHINLIALRDLSGNYWNVDTVYVLCKPENQVELRQLAETWKADEIDWLTDKQASHALGTSPTGNKVLRVWWD